MCRLVFRGADTVIFFLFFFSVFQVSMLLGCVCCACRTQYDGIAVQSICLIALRCLHYDVDLMLRRTL